MWNNNFIAPGGIKIRPEHHIAKNNKSDKRLLLRELGRAVILSNIYKEPVIIQHLNTHGELIQKEIMVLTVTERYLVMKGGAYIPIDSIKKVIL